VFARVVRCALGGGEYAELGAAVSDPDEVGENTGMPWGNTGSNSHSNLSRNPKKEVLSAVDRRVESEGRSGRAKPEASNKGSPPEKLIVKSE
jgi:hypothetical protein